MLDENLPTFYIKPSSDKPKYNSTLYFSQHGSEPKPAYSLRHLDPSLPASKNRYNVGLYDAFIPDVLYGEVLLIPNWTQPSLSQDAIRANGGVPPPPEPILPKEFVIQLYNPDQQITVRHKPKTWNSAASWAFEMPQQTFREPSISALDRRLSDPAASDLTPKLRFNWRKDGKLSKDLGCYLSGKTVVSEGTQKKSKEPDITLAIFEGFKEVTLYEPNLYRVDMEDFKGLEVVLLLGAAVIRDVFFGPLKETFHISDPPSPGSMSHSASTIIPTPAAPVVVAAAAAAGVGGAMGARNNNNNNNNNGARLSNPTNSPNNNNINNNNNTPARPHSTIPPRDPRPPPVDPRTQWELDAETTRLKDQAKAEARELRRREKEQEKRTQKLLEAEERESRRKQTEIERETERLKKLYGEEEAQYRRMQKELLKKQKMESQRPNLPARPVVVSSHNRVASEHNFNPASSNTEFLSPYQHVSPDSVRPQSAFFHRPPPAASSSMANLGQTLTRPPQQLKDKRSFFSFRRRGEDGQGDGSGGGNTLTKKRSSMF
ncbi:hypothetical protein AJ80_04127 [Polytolypa hystricis UAMH7299]|uniref:Uncharacterized protein n=1 Tax=Polytolypa hystricis (strain UAMH7299) TaxID=1447883 RepID=A0A2B7YDX9_POLH7|nr:hypothetical protein AJ80_04127 [Polytolypa hystricis UAMH7299]